MKEHISLQVMLHFQVFSSTELCINKVPEAGTINNRMNYKFSHKNKYFSSSNKYFLTYNKKIIESDIFFITCTGDVKYICMTGSSMRYNVKDQRYSYIESSWFTMTTTRSLIGNSELILTPVSGLITSQNLQQVHTWLVSRH